MSDQLLSVLNLLLQWIAVIGTVLALTSSVGLIFTRREISQRQAVALAVANSNAAVAKQLAGDLGKEVERVKKYSYVAGLTFNGMVYTDGDVIMPTPISESVKGTWSEVSPGKFRPVCEAAALKKARAAIQEHPDFPFSHYALAYCLKRNGDSSWRQYAEQAVRILENTTQINNHQKSHDEALVYLRQLMAETQ